MLGYLSPAYTSVFRLDLQLQNISWDDIFMLMLNVAKEVEKFARKIFHTLTIKFQGG